MMGPSCIVRLHRREHYSCPGGKPFILCHDIPVCYIWVAKRSLGGGVGTLLNPCHPCSASKCDARVRTHERERVMTGTIQTVCKSVNMFGSYQH